MAEFSPYDWHGRDGEVFYTGNSNHNSPVELADSVAPHQISYAIDQGRRYNDYELIGDEALSDRIRNIIGFNAIGTTDNGMPGRIRRVTPVAHPEDLSLHASTVNLTGYGRPKIAPSANEAIDPPDFHDDDNQLGLGLTPDTIAPDFALYPYYLAKVEYLLRPYHVLTDYHIQLQEGAWFNEYGLLETFQFANEFDRYLEIDEKFDPKIVTATQGQLVFRTQDKNRPDGAAFAGQPRIPYNETTIKMMWHQVPYHYISSRRSFLKRFALHVNQSIWVVQDYTFEPGELLYLGFEYSRYTPSFPPVREFKVDLGWVWALAQAVNLEKWANITLMFAWAPRETDNAPVLPNGNWIAAGHNLLPWFGPGNASTPRRGFHYACSFNPSDRDDRNYWQPTYESAPFELLFTDPDFVPEGRPSNPFPV